MDEGACRTLEYDPEFEPNTTDRGFKSWILKDTTLPYNKGTIETFERLKLDENFGKKDFYRFFKVFSGHNISRQRTLVTRYSTFLLSNVNKGVVFRIYKALQSRIC